MATALPLDAVNMMLRARGSDWSRSRANWTLRLFLSNTVIDGNADNTTNTGIFCVQVAMKITGKWEIVGERDDDQEDVITIACN